MLSHNEGKTTEKWDKTQSLRPILNWDGAEDSQWRVMANLDSSNFAPCQKI